MRRLGALLLLLSTALPALPALAAGPRWVTGPPFYTTSGKPVVWKQTTLTYFTDPGDLSGSVKHQAADALVAAAAGVWNLPVANITLQQGGTLAEHVSGADVYLDSAGMVWPADVDAANSAVIPIAVVYDTDGSVIDALEGAGASDPSGCAQTGVVETVDSFDPGGFVLHAIVVINGRCTGPAPEQQTELEYQLVRVFGRVLGLAWSQTNDNVFTGTPTPTYQQEMHWPVMHPIDLNCGPYRYQCLPQPFTLRDDDVAAMTLLYPVMGTPAAGKQLSTAGMQTFLGNVAFPSGEGMAGVNVLVRREVRGSANAVETWVETSAISGALWRRNGVSPFAVAGTDVFASGGSSGAGVQGTYQGGWFPLQSGTLEPDQLVLSTEALNPLYTGEYGPGPYAAGTVSPAGSAPVPYVDQSVGSGQWVSENWTIADAPTACGTGADGSFAVPAAIAASGWWTGGICPVGHAAYVGAAVKANRSFTVEMTALDANGFATSLKLMPVLAAYAPGDSAPSAPSLGLQATAFNAVGVGTTTLTVATGSFAGLATLGFADQRGDGRPDFPYQARMLYADSVTPATVPETGGTETIAGVGFRQGNAVWINGVEAAVASWTANALVLTVPAMSAVGAIAGTAVDVEVVDRETGGTTTIFGGLTYAPGPSAGAMLLVSAPSGTQWVGRAASVPFAVRLVAADGVTPVAGVTVNLAASGVKAQLAVCATQASCTAVSDANGMVSTGMTAEAAGTLTLSATAGSLTQSLTLVAQTAAASMVVFAAPSGSFPVGQAAPPGFGVTVLDAKGHALAGDAITYGIAPGSTGSATFSGCIASTCGGISNASGQVGMAVTPTVAGTVILTASDAEGLSVQATFTATASGNVLLLESAASATVTMRVSPPGMTVFLEKSGSTNGVSGQVITFTGSPGFVLNTGGSIAEIYTVGGYAQMYGSASEPGVYTLTASYAGQSVVTTYTVIPVPGDQLSIVSVPTGVLTPYVAASAPVVAQLLDYLGQPISSAAVSLAGPFGGVVLSCGYAACPLVTDGNGMVSTRVTPLVSGSLTLSATSDPWGNPTALVALATITVGGSGPMLQVVSSPPATVPVGTNVTYQLRLLGTDGAPAVGVLATLTLAGPLTDPGCVQEPCYQRTDANGLLTILGSAAAPGQVTVYVGVNGLSAQTSFMVVAPAMSLKVISAPSGTVASGAMATPFAVEVVGADGITPVKGQNVTFSLTGGTASFAACSPIPCVVQTGVSGIASTGSIASSGGNGGLVSLVASDNGMTATASYTVAGKPDLLLPVTEVAGTVTVGAAAAPAFNVRVVLADGVTPDPGKTVSFGVNTGSVQMSGCSGASPCVVVSGADGTAGVVLTPTAAGIGSVSATLGMATVTDVFGATDSLALTALEPQTWVAEGAAVALELDASAVKDGVAATGVPVIWSSSAGLMTSAASVSTDAQGRSAVDAVAGPLKGGVTANATACAWGNVCAGFAATGVPAAVWQLAMVSGGGQVVADAALAPVVVQVTDGQGHPVAGAPVTVGQTVYADDGDCPATGRCPAEPVLASEQTVEVSDLKGEVVVQPLVRSGSATRTKMSFSSGVHGALTTEETAGTP